MSNTRKTIQSIAPSQHATFDQQFWPILVALSVLLGIALGAAVTLLKGSWMWTSLLVLPTCAALAIVVLYKVDNSRLRRSLQLAIICSLAAHLLILIGASMTSIWENSFEKKTTQVAQRQPKSILISQKQTPFVWQQPNVRETPDTKVEVQREQTKSVSKPQPVPVKQTEPKVNPQITRRKTPSQTVPRLDSNLSQLRRQSRNQTPQSSQRAQSIPAPKQTQQKNEQASAAAPSANKQSSASNKPSVSRPSKSAERAKPSQSNMSKIASRSERARPEASTNNTTKSSQSTARIRRSSPRIPKTTPVKTQQVEARPTQKERPRVQPSRSASQLVRRSTQADQTNPSRTKSPQTKPSRQTQVSKVTQRRTEQKRPTISSANATPSQPRRSTVVAARPTTTQNAEAPARTVKSNSTAREIKTQTASVTRGETGVVGATRQRNMDRGTSGTPSPATRASDSLSRRVTQSQPTPNQLMAPSLRSTRRRSVAQAPSPSTAFKAETQQPSRIAGSNTPSERSVESSANQMTASTANHRGQVMAQKGESSVDLGPTKLVPEQTVGRRSGGGQPEIAQMNPEPAARSNRRFGDQAPRINAETGLETADVAQATSSPSSSESPEPNAESMLHSRETDGAESVVSERGSASEVGEAMDHGQQQVAEFLADSRERASYSKLASMGEEDEDEEELMRGNSTRRLAQAPSLNVESGLRASSSDGGVRDNQEIDTGESLAAAVVKRAAGALAGSVTRSTTSQIAGAMAAMPLVDLPSNERANRGQSQLSEGQPSETRTAANTPRSARGRGTQGNAPSPSNSMENSISSIADGVGSSERATEISTGAMSADRASNVDGLALDIDAMEGPAGLGHTPTANLGVRTRPASKTSQQIQPDLNTRFRSERFGGTPAVNPDAALANQAFRSRRPAASAGSEPSTEAAIQLGLEFLARNQEVDGSWTLDRYDRKHPFHNKQLVSPTAATGLALLAFQGAGYNHKEYKYARQLNQAIQSLVENQQPNGDLYIPSRGKSDESCHMYSHAIACLALCEAYGMTQDPELREPTQRALDWISMTQDPDRGGWRYYPGSGPDRGRRRTDTSVTGWMMMALHSGRLAELDIDKETMKGIEGWLKGAADPARPSQFSYDPYLKNAEGISRNSSRQTTPPMTAVGLLMQIYNGWEKDDPRLIDGAQSMLDAQLPGDQNNMVRDTYYWYYATQVLKHVDGPRWKQWNNLLHPLLIKSQEREGDMSGSWDPYGPVPDRWGIHAGRLYVTTMNLLSLEVRYRMLPIYKEFGDDEPPAK